MLSFFMKEIERNDDIHHNFLHSSLDCVKISKNELNFEENL